MKSHIAGALPEILSEIFLILVTEEARHLQQQTAPPPSRYPWSLAGVCRRWRAICLETPLLWSYINFAWHYAGDFAEDPTHFPFELLQLQLDRCRSAIPLTIFGTQYCGGCDDVPSVWTAIAAHSDRWKEVYFGCTEADQEKFNELIRDNNGFASLQHLTFRSENFDFEFTSFPFSPDVNRSLHNLRSLTLEKLVNPRALEGFPCQQLTRLSLLLYGGLPADLLNILLRQCENLVDFDLSFEKNYEGMEVSDIAEVVPKGSVVLPQLRSFALTNHGHLYTMFIFPFLRLPSLRSLSVTPVSIGRHDGDEYDLLVSVLGPLPSSLTELNLDYWGEPEFLIELLQSIPKLRALTFRQESSGQDRLLLVLSKQPNSTLLCPSLRQLRLHCDPSCLPFDPELLVKAIESRIMDAPESPAPFTSTHIICPADASTKNPEKLEDFKNTLIRGLRQFTDDGFELRFFSSEEIDFAEFSLSS